MSQFVAAQHRHVDVAEEYVHRVRRFTDGLQSLGWAEVARHVKSGCCEHHVEDAGESWVIFHENHLRRSLASGRLHRSYRSGVEHDRATMRNRLRNREKMQVQHHAVVPGTATLRI